MTLQLVLLTFLLALGSHPCLVQGAEQTEIVNAEDGSLHIVSEKDVHINATANGRVFLNGIDVVERLQQHQRDYQQQQKIIEQLMDQINGSTPTSCDWEDIRAVINSAYPASITFDVDGIDMEDQGLSAFSFRASKCSFPRSRQSLQKRPHHRRLWPDHQRGWLHPTQRQQAHLR